MQRNRDEKGKSSTSADGDKRAEKNASRVDDKAIHVFEEEGPDSDLDDGQFV